MKFHAIRHVPRNIIFFGCLENVSTNSGEHAHIAQVKNIARNTNRRQDWERQIMAYHVRREASSDLNRALHHRFSGKWYPEKLLIVAPSDVRVLIICVVLMSFSDNCLAFVFATDCMFLFAEIGTYMQKHVQSSP
jgi:hypothetical protein